MIDRSGRVSSATIDSNELPDCTVARCLRYRVLQYVFAPTEGDPVTVIYPIVLEPG